jgi:hypothetical protein
MKFEVVRDHAEFTQRTREKSQKKIIGLDTTMWDMVRTSII